MKNKILIIILILISFSVYGQELLVVDSLVSHKAYLKQSTNLATYRIGIGIHQSPYGEIGVANHKYRFNDLGIASSAYYLSFEWISTILTYRDNEVYGLKIGYEINTRLLTLALEAKYQTDFTRENFIVTPQIGICLLKNVVFYYGHNIPIGGGPLLIDCRDQFSIIVNLNHER